MKNGYLEKGDTIGIASPSWIVKSGEYDAIFAAIESFGFKVKPASNPYADGWGFAASPEQRAEAIHELVRDKSVSLIFFGGGEGADDVLPYLDFSLIKSNPKLWMSFSDGTSILNAIHFRTGLPMLYGQCPSDFEKRMNPYNQENFMTHVCGIGQRRHLKNSRWITLTPGVASGELSAGYLDNYTYLANGGWIVPEDKDYILCLEEHQMFFIPEHVSDELARLENSPMMAHCRGILFGEYSPEPDGKLLSRLTTLGRKHGIPVIYCSDFGHGEENKAILEIGASVTLNADTQELIYH